VQIDDFLLRVKQWAEKQIDIHGVLLVGSYARGAARPDSDVDLVILTDCPERYIDTIAFAGGFGSVLRWLKEDWGQVASLRVWYEDGLEVEYGIAFLDWAVQPLDSGTLRVVSDGVQILFDRNGSLGWLARNDPSD
jgi:predicted nucleotidyltransferase